MNFSQFIFRRTLMVIPLLVGVVFLTFMLVRVGGLDPVGLLAGPTATAEEFDMIRKELGLDQPLWKQFLIYAGNVVQGDLGESWLSNRPVLEDISSRSLISLELLFWGIGLGTLIGVPLGLRAVSAFFASRKMRKRTIHTNTHIHTPFVFFVQGLKPFFLHA